jgi:hypothetical protein
MGAGISFAGHLFLHYAVWNPIQDSHGTPPLPSTVANTNADSVP